MPIFLHNLTAYLLFCAAFGRHYLPLSTYRFYMQLPDFRTTWLGSFRTLLLCFRSTRTYMQLREPDAYFCVLSAWFCQLLIDWFIQLLITYITVCSFWTLPLVDWFIQLLTTIVMQLLDSATNWLIYAAFDNRLYMLQLLDSAAYFLTEVERIGMVDYIPSEMDVLRARSITTGIIKVPFKVNQGRQYKFTCSKYIIIG